MSVYKKTSLGFKINSTAIPDPSSFSYTIADLDASGSRDTTGLLHRERVATKRNVSLSYDVLDWDTISSIVALLNNDSFTFEYPIPESANNYTGTYYVSNRTVEMYDMVGTTKGDYRGKLAFELIEY